MRRTAVAVLLAIAVSACGGGDGDDGAGAASPSTVLVTVAPTLPAEPTTTTAPFGGDQPVTLAFGGDVHFEGSLRRALATDPGVVLAPIAPVLSAADVAVVNLETAITERGEPAPKQYTFRAPPSALAALAAAGVDVASMANNHGLDFGPTGLADTLAATGPGRFPVVGIGRNAAEAYAPWRTTVRGQRIAIFGATQVLDGDLVDAWSATDAQAGLASAKPPHLARLLDGVRAARADSDTVVVFLHWGTEGASCPNAVQPGLARALVDAGADVVVGGHAHRLQGAGRLGEALVAYGLGNFAFYAQPGPGAETGVLRVTVTGRRVDGYEWVPAVIRDGVPHPLDGEAAAAAVRAWDALRPCTRLQP